MNKNSGVDFNLSCPIPIEKYPIITMAHGGGGRIMNNLIEQMFLGPFQSSLLDQKGDSAVISHAGKKIAFTTDSYVISPIFFPGGDIGSLSVFGTANDLSMSGAKPHALSIGLILEEGFPMENLWRIVQAIKSAATRSQVEIATGDTKVVEKGKGDGIYINTSGVGFIDHNLEIMPSNLEAGDVIIINGDVGSHGIAIMATREGLELESSIESDSAPLTYIVENLIAEGIGIHMMRDLTRGGLTSALNEIAGSSNFSIEIRERDVPVKEEVKGACEILGLDPFYIANEGKMIAIIKERDAARALDIMKESKNGKNSRIIGRVIEKGNAPVIVESLIGSRRILDMSSGDQLPRIC